MGLTSLAASGGAQESGRHWQRLLTPVNRRGWAVLLVLAIISTLLLPVLEVEAVTDEYVYADRIFGDVAWWLRSSPLVPVLLALGFATGFIHYLLDRAAFRFSSPEVREAGYLTALPALPGLPGIYDWLLASSATRANASASWTARSASIFRSIWTPALARPAIRRL